MVGIGEKNRFLHNKYSVYRITKQQQKKSEANEYSIELD